MKRQMDRSKSRPKTGNVSLISSNRPNNPKNATQRRMISTGRNKSINDSKEKREKNQRHQNGNEMLSPKTIEYSKIAEKFGEILDNNNNNFHSNFHKYSNNLIEKNKGEKSSHRNKSNISEDEYYNIKTPFPKPDNTENKSNDTINSNKKQPRVPSQKKEIRKYSLDKEKAGNLEVSKKKSENYTTKNKSETNTTINPQINFRESDYMNNLQKETELLRKENLLLKKQLQREKNKSYQVEAEYNKSSHNILNASQLEKLKDKIDNVEKENEELKSLHSESLQKAEDKIKLFLKICRKYTQKIKNLMILYSKIETANLESVNESRDNILLELNQTIEKFNKTIYHPQLINKLIEFNPNRNTKKLFEDQLDSSLDDGYLTNQLNLLDAIKNLESQIKKLNEENFQLTRKKNELESGKSEYLNNISNKTEAVTKIKKKLDEEKLAREELQDNFNSTRKIVKELERKNKKLEDEICHFKKNEKISDEKLKDFEFIKNKNFNLETELKYKDTIINYLESILESNNISYSKNGNIPNNNNNNYTFKKKNLSREKEYEKLTIHPESSEDEIQLTRKNQNSIYENKNKSRVKFDFSCDAKDDSNIKINFFSNEKNESINSQRYNSKLNTENDNLSRNSNKEYDKEKKNSSGKNLKIKNEIEYLDDEIKHLQSKLKNMIDVGKK